MSTVIEQRIATLIGNLGLVPFFVLAILTWMPWRDAASLRIQFALVGYTAVVLVVSGRGSLGPGAGQSGARQGPGPGMHWVGASSRRCWAGSRC